MVTNDSTSIISLPSSPAQDNKLGDDIPSLDTTFEALSEAQESSVESDELSLSDLDDDLVNLEDPHFEDELFLVIRTVSAKLLAGFRLTGTSTEGFIGHSQGPGILTLGECSSGEGLSTDNTEGLEDESSTSASDPGNPKTFRSIRPKRERGNALERDREGGDEEDEDDGGNIRLPKKLRTAYCDTGRKFLACPFWKLNARRHRDCFKRKLDGIPRVKQHLRRNHYNGNHRCERCKTVFVDDGPYQDHLRQQCTFREAAVPEWISHQTRLALARKSKPQYSESQKWFEIWDLLFPGAPAPSLAYIDPNLSEDLSEFRLYAHDHGPRILQEELENVGVRFEVESSASRQDVVSAAIRRAQEQLLEEWLESYSLPPEASSDLPESVGASSADIPEVDAYVQPILNNAPIINSQGTPGITRSLDELPDVDVAATDDQQQGIVLLTVTDANHDDPSGRIEVFPRDNDRETGEELDMFIDYWPGVMGAFSEMEAEVYYDIQDVSSNQQVYEVG
ncbi:hypothetical protein PG997_009998 [Apiospora hydei]|uniref:C2H2-type domain-containing protein n=1 Tax=Apiospora hydei TaxID=1337664 RepID=A0ABR1VYT8_9PEZI